MLNLKKSFKKIFKTLQILENLKKETKRTPNLKLTKHQHHTDCLKIILAIFQDDVDTMS